MVIAVSDLVVAVMMENIDKVIQRGESIEVLVDKTERLDMSSQSFKVTCFLCSFSV